VSEAIRVERYRLRVICSGRLERAPIRHSQQPGCYWLYKWSYDWRLRAAITGE
jgi:hypothetical protein